MASEVSFHPPHLVDYNGSLPPTALIPFCAYQNSLTFLASTTQDLPFTVCSQFQPMDLEGQICYTLDISSLKPEKSEPGLKNGLMLLIDAGTSIASQEKKKNPVRIFLNKLASFSEVANGTYAISGLKKMTGTKSFLELPDETKRCQLQTFEECQAQSYSVEVQEQCGCVPWGLKTTGLTEVRQLIDTGLYQLPLIQFHSGDPILFT